MAVKKNCKKIAFAKLSLSEGQSSCDYAAQLSDCNVMKQTKANGSTVAGFRPSVTDNDKLSVASCARRTDCCRLVSNLLAEHLRLLEPMGEQQVVSVTAVSTAINSELISLRNNGVW